MITDDLRQVRERLADVLADKTGTRACRAGRRRRALTAALRQVERIEADATLATEPPELTGLTFDELDTAFTDAGWVETDRAGYYPFGPADRRHGVRAVWTLDGHQVTIGAVDGQGPRVRYDGEPLTTVDELNAAIDGDLPPLAELTTLANQLLGTFDAGPPVAMLTYIAGQLRRHAIRAARDQDESGRR
jgi:hypothetical protein